MRPAALGASIAALAVSTGSLLAPQAASALDFTFSFAGVTGLIENLVLGPNTCYQTACVVTVTNNGGATASLGRYLSWGRGGTGFFVFTYGNGNYDIEDEICGIEPVPYCLDWDGSGGGSVGNRDLCFGQTYCKKPDGLLYEWDGYLGRTSNNPAVVAVVGKVNFALVQPPTPSSTSVPGPLPLFGAAAAFGFSRKLRNRIKKSGNSAASTFTLVGR